MRWEYRRAVKREEFSRIKAVLNPLLGRSGVALHGQANLVRHQALPNYTKK